MPAVIGHRGAGTLEPENTLRGFRRGEQLGADEMELDIRLTKDGRLAVIHDATVDRTTGGAGAVADMTWAELQQLDAGQGEKIPLFQDVLESTAVPLQVEIKAPEALDYFVDVVAQYGVVERLYATSQQAALLQKIHALMPQLDLGLIVPRPTIDTVHECVGAGATVVCPGMFTLTEEIVESLQARSIRILPWPINNADDHAKVVGFGVEGFATDRLDLVPSWSQTQV